MTPDILSWPVAVLSILFLSACAWNNRRTGYSRSSRKAGWNEWNSVVSHNTRTGGSRPCAVSVTPKPLVPEPPVYSDSVDASTQLIRLSEALHPGEKVRTEPQQETGAVESSANRLLRTHRRGDEGRQGPEYSEGKTSTGTSQIRGMLLKNALRNYPIAFISVLTATILGQGTVLLSGNAPMGFFIVAVIISAGRGITTGLLATALSFLVMLSIFRENISISNATQSILALFLMIGIVTNVVFYKLHLRNAAVTRAKAALEAVNQQLQDHAESLAEANSRLAEQNIALFEAHELELSPKVRQTVKTHFSSNGELSHGIVSTEVHERV